MKGRRQDGRERGLDWPDSRHWRRVICQLQVSVFGISMERPDYLRTEDKFRAKVLGIRLSDAGVHGCLIKRLYLLPRRDGNRRRRWKRKEKKNNNIAQHFSSGNSQSRLKDGCVQSSLSKRRVENFYDTDRCFNEGKTVSKSFV